MASPICTEQPVGFRRRSARGPRKWTLSGAAPVPRRSIPSMKRCQAPPARWFTCSSAAPGPLRVPQIGEIIPENANNYWVFSSRWAFCPAPARSVQIQPNPNPRSARFSASSAASLRRDGTSPAAGTVITTPQSGLFHGHAGDGGRNGCASRIGGPSGDCGRPSAPRRPHLGAGRARDDGKDPGGFGFHTVVYCRTKEQGAGEKVS